MNTSWKTTTYGTFEIVDRQGAVAKFFGGLMLFFTGLPIYWLGRALVEYFRFGTLKDVLYAIPGMVVTLFLAALFGVPGVLMAFLKKKTLCNKDYGLIRQITYFGVFQRVKEVRLSDVKEVRVSNRKEVKLLGNDKRVASWFKTTKGSYFTRPTRSPQLFLVELVLTDEQRVKVAVLEKWDALELGKQLAGYLGVEFQEL